MAGYEKEVKECFFSINKGLERRFQWIHRIGDYSKRDLALIMKKMIKDFGWEINMSVERLSEFIEKNKHVSDNFSLYSVFFTECSPLSYIF